MRGRVAAALAAGLSVVLVLAGCSGGSDSTPSNGNPLTGLSGRPSGPVLGVKIGDTASGKPQFGLAGADLVYVELAEGGATRLIAIYASHRPDAVGPVRSVRSSDPEVLGAFGPMALAFSGGAAGVLEEFAGSSLVDASAAAHPDAYHRDPDRRAPYNLLLDVDRVSDQVSGAAGVRDIGLVWSADEPNADSARRVSRFTVTMGSTPVAFSWDASAGRWVRQRGGRAVTGADGEPTTTRNVLVQFCRVTPDRSDIDQAGNPAQYTHAVGDGRAVLFRDGRMIDGRWSRDDASDPTRYTDRDGDELTLRPGGVWVLLAPTDSPLDTG